METDLNTQEADRTPRRPRPFVVRHWKALLALLIFIIVMVLLGRYIQSKQPIPNTGRRGANQGATAVSTATVAASDIDVKIPALGTVTPLATITVRTQISGVMQRIYFTEGQIVRQGEALAQIDPRPYEAALQQAQGALKRDQALLADARLDRKRYEGLVKEDSIAQQQLDTQRSLVDQYIGAVESDEGNVKTAQVNLAFTHITAPITGRVGIRQVDQGNYVTPGDTNGIVLLNQVQPITVIFTVPEDHVSVLQKRLNSGASLAVEAFDRTNSTKIADGKVLTLDNSIDVTTGTVKLRAQFENADSALFPNQFVNISLLQDTLKDQLVMPNAAVRRGAPNGAVSTFVYLVKPDNTVAVQPVTLGVIDAERVAVVKGLKAGDVVVTEGGDRLRDGAQVLLPEAAPAPEHPQDATPAQPDAAAAKAGAGQRHRRQREKPAP